MILKKYFQFILTFIIVLAVIALGCTTIVTDNSVKFFGPVLINSSGNYILTNDIFFEGSSNDVIQILSPNVTFDGNFHTITCSEGHLANGVRIAGDSMEYGNVTNVTIKNLKVNGCDSGIFTFYPYGNSYYTIENNTITNSMHGIVLGSGDRNTLKRNSVHDNRFIGIMIFSDSDFNILENNKVTRNSDQNYVFDMCLNKIIEVEEEFPVFNAEFCDNFNSLINNNVINNGPRNYQIDTLHNEFITISRLGNIIRKNYTNPYTEDVKEKLASLDKVLALNPNNIIAWRDHAGALGNLDRHTEAVASLDKALALNPNDFIIWRDRGIELGQAGRYIDAVDSYDKALAINPNDSSSWDLRGFALAHLGRCSEARASSAKALAINPSDQLLFWKCNDTVTN